MSMQIKLRLLACGIALIGPAVSVAATYIVDRFDDIIVTNCLPEVRLDCSLRGAIYKARFTGGISFVNLPAGHYTLTIRGDDEDGTLTGDLDLFGAIVITGAGMHLTTIDAGGSTGLGDRVFHVHPDADVNISKLTFRGGLSPNKFGGGIRNSGFTELLEVRVIANLSSIGGGIYNGQFGDLTVLNSVIEDNNTPISGKGAGAGIYSERDGKLTVEGSAILDNGQDLWPQYGGGIFCESSCTIKNSIVSGNRSNHGGGLVLAESLGDKWVENSEVSDNFATEQGGGIWTNALQLRVVSSTISANIVPNFVTIGDVRQGGGIWADGGTVQIRNSTISGNTVGGGTYGSGGGVWLGDGGTLTLSHATVVDNKAFGGDALYNLGTATITNSILQSPKLARDPCGGVQAFTRGGNLISADPFLNNNSATCGFHLDDQTNVTLAELNLAPLADNGGATRTHALLEGSFAINKGSLTWCFQLDQREWKRVDGACDVGAFELGAANPEIIFMDGFEEQ
jgi:hypothetical protein